MRILIFEWLTGGGLWWDGVSPDADPALQSQGHQMLHALVEDFLSAGFDVVVPLDARLEDERWRAMGAELVGQRDAEGLPDRLRTLAQTADHVILIAPESQSCLLRCLEWVNKSRDKLISPEAALVSIATDKQRTYRFLMENDFTSIPQGLPLKQFLTADHGVSRALPVVMKPIDGAGSEGVELVTDQSRLVQIQRTQPERYWVEPFIRGTPVSVSVLCGPAGCQFLPATGQVFAQHPFGEYVRASYPLDPDLASRAEWLARQVVDVLPTTKGYIGLDMVLSDQSDAQDCLIEINPRLTMSYLKLRQIGSQNLARRMFDIALGVDSWVESKMGAIADRNFGQDESTD